MPHGQTRPRATARPKTKPASPHVDTSGDLLRIPMRELRMSPQFQKFQKLAREHSPARTSSTKAPGLPPHLNCVHPTSEVCGMISGTRHPV